MNGLDNIIKKIEDEAACTERGILEKAGQDAEKILLDAQNDADAECAVLERKTEEKAALALSNARSGAELLKKKAALKAKTEIISGIISEAFSRMEELPDDVYFNAVKGLACRYSRKGEGELLLSQRDLERLPKSFEKDLASSLPAGAVLRLVPAGREFGCGCVLRYGDIEENCSFSALRDEKLEELRDLLYREIFG